MMEAWNRDRSAPTDGRTKRNVKTAADKRREREERRKETMEDLLDRGLEETFPASDPVAIIQPPASIYDRRAH